MLPTKTVVEDLDKITTYLKSQIGWVPTDKVKKFIDAKFVDGRKLEAYKRLGVIERDGSNIKLSSRGQTFSSGPEGRAEAMVEAIRDIPIYRETLEWINWNSLAEPSKTAVGNYWHDSHTDQLEGAQGSALSDAVIFFLRVCAAAGFGKFTRGNSNNPDSYLKADLPAIATFVNSNQPVADEGSPADEGGYHSAPDEAPAGSPPPPPAQQIPLPSAAPASVSTSPAVHVNIEIHIAADATAETVAEIFKNMRKYVLSDQPSTSDGE